MDWTYNLYGRPGGSLGVHVVRDQEDPGQVVIAEREHDAGVCDGYLLRDRNESTRTAFYDWVVMGTPEMVIETVAQRMKEKWLRG